MRSVRNLWTPEYRRERPEEVTRIQIRGGAGAGKTCYGESINDGDKISWQPTYYFYMVTQILWIQFSVAYDKSSTGRLWLQETCIAGSEYRCCRSKHTVIYLWGYDGDYALLEESMYHRCIIKITYLPTINLQTLELMNIVYITIKTSRLAQNQPKSISYTLYMEQRHPQCSNCRSRTSGGGC